MARLWNFSAGPAALPEEVLRQVQDELLDWRGAGCSVMEMSHRSKEFAGIAQQAEADLRDLLGIPANYRVLFLQGGATQQFAQVPMNLLAGRSADYVINGSWSQKAFKEAQRVAGQHAARCAAVVEGRFPAATEMDLDQQAAYLHICSNETVHGIEMFDETALPPGVPVVADMSSHILSRPMDVSRYGLIYAGAQKNIGPSGLTLVIVRDDLLGQAPANLPSVMDYAIMAQNDSMLNTPPTLAIYIAGLIFQWLKRQGGLSAMAQVNRAKAEALYRCIESSQGFYHNPVAVPNRSLMNVVFTLPSPALEAAFLGESKAQGLLSLRGHKSLGGMRASIYNAMPLAGVEALVAFMNDFARRNA